METPVVHPALRSPLHHWHQSHGARMDTIDGWEVPAVYASAEQETATARAGLPGLIKQPPRRTLQKGSQSFQWVALDKNEDALQYDLYYRSEADRNWILLKKNVEDTFYTINSDTLPDGTYVVRLVATHRPPGRLTRLAPAIDR